MAGPIAKVSIDPTFEKRLRDLKNAAKAAYESAKQGNSPNWCRPTDWDGDLTDPETLSEPFEAKQAIEETVAAMKDPESPGVVGDVVLGQIMTEWLAVQERAARVRFYSTRPRMWAHASGRQRSFGDDKGPFGDILEYARALTSKSRAK